MSASPEAATEVEHVKPETLKDPAERAKVLEKYTQDLDQKQPWEVDALVNEAVTRGIFKQSESDDAHFDDTFTNKLELSAVEVPGDAAAQLEVQAALNGLKDRKYQVQYEARTQELRGSLDNVPQAEWPDVLAARLEDSYRKGEVDVIPGRPGTQGRAERRDPKDKSRVVQTKIDAVPRTPAQIQHHDRNQLAVRRAFETAKSWMDSGKFDAMVDGVAKKKDSLDKIDAERKSKVEAHRKKEADERAEAARARIKELQETVHLKAGTKVEGVTAETRHLVNANNELLADTPKQRPVADAEIHEEAIAENHRQDLIRRYGTEKGEQKLAEEQQAAEQTEKMNAKMGKAQEAFDRAQPVANQLQQQMGGRKLEVSDFGPGGQLREQSAAIAEEEAYKVDREAREVKGVSEYYQRIIDAEPDQMVKIQLEQSRKEAIEAEKTRQTGLTKEIAQRRASALIKADEARIKSAKKEHSVDTVDQTTENLKEVAEERRKALNLSPSPFLEVKRGGIFARERGPKLVESYYWADNGANKHMVVMERRNRRTGDLISQTVMTTEKPLRHRFGLGGGTTLPPREIHKDVETVRAKDRQTLVEKSKSGMGSKHPGDFVRLGWKMGKTIDGPTGAYMENIKQMPAPSRNTEIGKLETYKKTGLKRRGGFLYWLSDENV